MVFWCDKERLAGEKRLRAAGKKGEKNLLFRTLFNSQIKPVNGTA
jgi:hypothetical protein